MPVNVIKYTCVNTIEEKIDKILEEKQTLFDIYIDDVSIDISENLNRDQLFGLFDIEPPGSKKSYKARKTGLELEARCKALLSKIGYTVKTTPISRDGGIDLIVERQYLNSTIGTLLNVLLIKAEAQAKQESNVTIDQSLQSAS